MKKRLLFVFATARPGVESNSSGIVSSRKCFFLITAAPLSAALLKPGWRLYKAHGAV